MFTCLPSSIKYQKKIYYNSITIDLMFHSRDFNLDMTFLTIFTKFKSQRCKFTYTNVSFRCNQKSESNKEIWSQSSKQFSQILTNLITENYIINGSIKFYMNFYVFSINTKCFYGFIPLQKVRCIRFDKYDITYIIGTPDEYQRKLF